MATERKPKRTYTKRQKVTAVIAAEMSSVTAAAEATGIPKRTVGYWFDSPDFATIRTKTREDLADESRGLAHRVLQEIDKKLPEFEPRDLAILYGILTDKAQLLSGGATSRLEHRELLNDMDDHEREAMTAWLRDLAREKMAEKVEV